MKRPNGRSIIMGVACPAVQPAGGGFFARAARKKNVPRIRQEDVMAKEIDAYIQAQPEEARPALEQMRAIIRSAAPGAEEIISYGIPAYRQNGMVVAFGAAKKHVGLYAMSPAVLEVMAKELASYETSKGTVRFPLGKPLDEKVIRKIVALRLAENEAKRAKK
jgi:uncharacterized protein YdhG (YjbR/CyaY superfamily)